VVDSIRFQGRPVILDGFVGEPLRGSLEFCQIYVWCPFDAWFHMHGVRCDIAPATLTSRGAHCYKNVPGWWDDYYIYVTDIPFECVRKSVRLPTDHQRFMISEGRTSPAIERLRRQVPHLVESSRCAA